jgi:predicted kinase
MTTLTITRGLPGSGKSTYADEWVAEDPTGRAQVNRDHLRKMMHNSVWIGGRAGTEGAVITARDAMIKALLRKGVDVICSDTNLPQKVARDMRNLATVAGAEFNVVDLTDVPLELCLERDAERDARFTLDRDGDPGVGEKVIRDMHARFLAGKSHPLPLPEEPVEQASKALPYVARPGTPEAIVVDIDGTVAIMGDRSPFDWGRVGEDTPNLAVIDAARNQFYLADESGKRLHVIFLSGRDEVCREATEAWLSEHFINYDFEDADWAHLYMRPEGDTRKDSIVKLELFDEHVRDAFTVNHVYDDRNQVVRMWRSIGLTVFQVAEGDF